MADFLFINPSSNPELLDQLLAVKSVAEAAPRQHVLGIRCKFRSPGTVHFGVTVPLISVVGFFISL